jgi:hypothetical protein
MKQELKITPNCIKCGKPLHERDVIKQGSNKPCVYNTTCSSGCRARYYRDITDTKKVNLALKNQNYTTIKHLKLHHILDLGYKVKIET